MNIVLTWCNLPEKTNQTLRHHLEDDGNINDDFVTLISIIKNDELLKSIGIEYILGSLLIIIIANGDYDSRFRVLLRHASALLSIIWEKFEEFEECLADRLSTEHTETDTSKQTRERLAKTKKIKRYALIGAAGSLGAVLIGLTSGLAAPLVASGIGTITASTAFAGLATTAGSAIFGSVFGVAGGGLASYKMKKRVGAIEEFIVESLSEKKQFSLQCILCVSGWIDGKDKLAFHKPWRHLSMSKEQFTLRYESKYLIDWGSALEYFVSFVVGFAIQRSLMETVLAGVFTAVAWPMVLISSASIIDNPWSVCFSRAAEVGEHLAEVLLSKAHGKRPITLVGFSLGARVIFYCLLAMSKRENSLGIIEDVILLGAPVSASPSQWQKICSVVGGRVINGYCTTDWLLRFLYRTASVQFTIAGTGPVENKHEKKIINFNLSHIIKGHTEYSKKLTEVLNAVGLRVTPLSEASCQDLLEYDEKMSNKDDHISIKANNIDFVNNTYENKSIEKQENIINTNSPIQIKQNLCYLREDESNKTDSFYIYNHKTSNCIENLNQECHIDEFNKKINLNEDEELNNIKKN